MQINLVFVNENPLLEQAIPGGLILASLKPTLRHLYPKVTHLPIIKSKVCLTWKWLKCKFIFKLSPHWKWFPDSKPAIVHICGCSIVTDFHSLHAFLMR